MIVYTKGEKMKEYKCPECGWNNFRSFKIIYGFVVYPLFQCTKCKSLLYAPDYIDENLQELQQSVNHVGTLKSIIVSTKQSEE